VTHATAAGITLRPFSRDEFDAASRVVGLAFGSPARPEERDVFADALEFDRTVGAYLGDRILGTAAAFTFQLTVPGGIAPAAGVTIVTVHPAHRRRGILSAMMARQLDDFRERGEPIAVLRASEASIYGRFGYAAASRELHLELPRSATEFAPGVRGAAAGSEALDLDEAGAVRAELAAVYDAARRESPGFIGRNEAAWTDLLFDPERRRGGATALRAALLRDADVERGYALYRVNPNWSDGLPAGRVHVQELIARDPAAAAILWQHVLGLDLTTTVEAGGRPVDEPLLRLLADPRRARNRIKDGLWLRLVRIDDALAARRYAAPVDLVLEVTDARCPWNAGRWRLAGDGTGATCTRSTDPADLRLDTTVLAAGYLGDPVLTGYAQAGRVAEESSGSLLRLATALGWTPGPWCPHHF
jgi:predicted acetyltransferase